MPLNLQENAGTTRRAFVKKSALLAAAATAGVYVGKQVLGANERIVVGYIGVGGQGKHHLESQAELAFEKNIAQAAVCDLSKTRLNRAKDAIGDCRTYSDYRHLLEQKDIDAVCISTVDHWHARIAIDALQAGKHVYLEKPMTRYLREAFALHDAAKSSGKCFQIGAQGCSDARWHKAAELICNGAIGSIVFGQGSYMRNTPAGEWNYTVHPWCRADDLDWDRWLGPVSRRISFSPEHYFRWRKYYPYCAGLLGDLCPHTLHTLMLATGKPEFPARVVSLGTRAIHTDRKMPGAPERDVPEMVQLMAEFPSGLTLVVTSSTVTQEALPTVIRGQKATLRFSQGQVDLVPEEPYGEEVSPLTLGNIQPEESVTEHEKNWFDCIRSGRQPNGNIDLAIRVQTVISLAEMSNRLNVMCVFDEKTRKITTASGTEIEPLTYGTLPLS